jgi:hypothetical protein
LDDGEEVADLVVDVGGVDDCLGDLGAKHAAETPPESIGGDLDGASLGRKPWCWAS